MRKKVNSEAAKTKVKNQTKLLFLRDHQVKLNQSLTNQMIRARFSNRFTSGSRMDTHQTALSTTGIWIGNKVELSIETINLTKIMTYT